MSLALFEARDAGLPLYHQCYESNRLPGTKHVRVYRERRKLLGAERTVVVVFSSTF